jgi:putative ABC transport system permease protein
VSILSRKRRREIAQQRWQFLAVLVAVVLGVALFAGSYNAYVNLGRSLDETYERLVMADMTVTGADAGFAAQAQAIDGVATAIDRRQADIPFDTGEHSFLGRIIALPATGQPAVNKVDLNNGRYLEAGKPTEVLLEDHAAEEFDLGVGDTLTIAGTEMTVVGIATSPEYLWPARDSQSMFTPPKSFGVAFVDESLLDAAPPAVAVRQTLIRYDDGVDVEEVDAAVTKAAEAAGASAVQLLADQPSNFAINEEMSGLRSMAVALPLLFLVAAGMAIYVVVTRLVFSQRGVIGTLRASGFSSRALSRHYRGFGTSVGLVGAAIGAVLGGLLGRGMTAMYTKVFDIPDLVAVVHLPTIVISLAFGLVAGLLAAVAPARTVTRMAPAEAMRGDAPPEGGRASIFERLVPPLRHVPVRWRMSLRGIGRNRRRSATMVLGVVLAMTLILAAWGVMDTMRLAIDRQFNDIMLEDAAVVLSAPATDSVVAALAQVDGVARAEPVIGLSVTVGHGDDRYTTQLQGFEADTQVHGFDPPLPSQGALLGEAMRDQLQVEDGDEITLEIPALETEMTTEVAGFVDEPLGTVAYMQSDAIEAALSAVNPTVNAASLQVPSITTVAVLYDTGADRQAVVESLGNLDEVAAVVDSGDLREQVDQLQAFFYLFIGMMLVFGGAMAFALMFNIISVNVAERAGEFASMRANGLSHRRVARLIMGETFLLTAIGVIPGLVVGYWAAVAFTMSFSSDQFPITAEVRPLSMIGAVVAMFVVAALSLVPAIRAVRRINVGEIVRERAI